MRYDVFDLNEIPIGDLEVGDIAAMGALEMTILSKELNNEGGLVLKLGVKNLIDQSETEAEIVLNVQEESTEDFDQN